MFRMELVALLLLVMTTLIFCRIPSFSARLGYLRLHTRPLFSIAGGYSANMSANMSANGSTPTWPTLDSHSPSGDHDDPVRQYNTDSTVACSLSYPYIPSRLDLVFFLTY